MPAFPRSTSNTLTITQAVIPGAILLHSANNTLSLAQTTISNFKVNKIIDVLSLNQESLPLVSIRSTSSQLTLSQSLIGTQLTHDEIANNTLNLTQNVIQNIKSYSALSELSLSQIVIATAPISISITQSLLEPSYDIGDIDPNDPDSIENIANNSGLRQSVDFRFIVKNIEIIQYLQLQQLSENIVPASASNHISLFDSARPVEYEIITQYLILQQSVTDPVFNHPTENTLELTQQLEIDLINFESVSSVIVLVQDVTYFPIPECESYPFTLAKEVILTYPYASPILTVILRNPDFGNIFQYDFSRINRLTLHNNLKVFVDSNWPKEDRLIYSFSGLTAVQSKALLEFMQVSLGDEIGLRDFENVQWKGIILNPAAPISEEGRDCNFSASFEFEGVVV